MNIDEKRLQHAYAPFKKVAIYRFCYYLLGLIIFWGIVFFILYSEDSHFLMEVGSYLLIGISLHLLILCTFFRLILLAKMEQKKQQYNRILIKIKNIKSEDYSDYKVPKTITERCFPEDVEAERNIFICYDQNGKRFRYRMIGSRKKMNNIRDWILLKDEKVFITYGKYTKIIVRMESTAPVDSMLYNNIKLLNYKF